MKFILSFLILFFNINLIAQQKFSKEISLVTDNDLYVSSIRDRYYTSGIFLTYRHLAKKENINLEKLVFEWQIGHKMYTPNKPTIQNILLHDRPFAAYLYGSLNIKRVYIKNQILSTSIQIGSIGPSAKGYELQNALHKLYDYKEVTGWKYQIKNAFGFNLGLEYIKFMTKSSNNKLDVSWMNTLNLGTVFSDLSTGLNLRLSFKPLQKIANSIVFKTNLNNTNTKYKREIESFFYFKPTLRYALYDATLQGSFLSTNNAVTKELIPFVFDMELGFKFTANRFNFGYIFNYNTSKSKGLKYTYGNKYGTIIINYLMH